MLSKPCSDMEIAEEPTPAESMARSLSPSYSSQSLFRGQKEILIDHQGCNYRLRITRTGGLILNK